MATRRMTRRVALGAVSALLGVFLTLCGTFYYQIYRANAAVQSVLLPPEPPPDARSRVLVLSPHCDDETLGAGGYMAMAARLGARVRVVMLTNGDGFPLAASREYHRLSPSSDTYLRLAALRQDETRAALKALGLPRDAVTFLGYPDGGLSHMWSRHWSAANPYTSPFTRCSASPYPNSYHPGSGYAGENAVRDLAEIIAAERPTDLLVPDPGDDHPDHWATYCFGIAALQSLRCRAEYGGSVVPVSTAVARTDWPAQVAVHTYLVHRGDWPVPQGMHQTARLVPPASLLHLDTRWNELLLTPEDRRRKRAAIAAHHSQTAVMGRFLASFARQNELFGRLPEAELSPLKSCALRDDGLPRDWQTGGTRMVDARGDTLISRLDPAADLVSLDAVADPARVYLRVTARAPLSRQIEYRVFLHPIGGADGRVAAPVVICLGDRRHIPPGVRSAVQGAEWQLAIPRAKVGAPLRLLVGAESRIGGVFCDRLSWRVVVLPEYPRVAARR